MAKTDMQVKFLQGLQASLPKSGAAGSFYLTTDTDRLVIAEWQSAVRSVDGIFSITLEQARQIAINKSGYKYAAYINENEDAFYFYMTNSKKDEDSINEAIQRNGRIPNGIEKVIYKVLKSSGVCEEEYSNVSSNVDSKLSESEAQEKLEAWLGGLGTWVAGEGNVLVCNGIYKCNGKEYYQFTLQGFVFDHYSTLTWYVISVDGTEMFEGQCNNGYLNKF